MPSFLTRLRPTEHEVRRMAAAETDPRLYARFAPITRGTTFAIIALAILGVAIAIWTPFWFLRSRRAR